MPCFAWKSGASPRRRRLPPCSPPGQPHLDFRAAPRICVPKHGCCRLGGPRENANAPAKEEKRKRHGSTQFIPCLLFLHAFNRLGTRVMHARHTLKPASLYTFFDMMGVLRTIDPAPFLVVRGAVSRQRWRCEGTHRGDRFRWARKARDLDWLTRLFRAAVAELTILVHAKCQHSPVIPQHERMVSPLPQFGGEG